MAIKRDFTFLIFGRLGSAILALASMRAVTTYLTPQQYGELSLLLTVQMFCGLFLLNPVGQHINLNTYAWWKDGTLFCRLKKFRSYICLVGIIGLFGVFGFKAHDTLFNLVVSALAMFAMVIFGTWNATLIHMLNMLGWRDSSVIWGILSATIGLIASIFISQYWPTSVGWFIGQTIGMAFGAWGSRAVLHRNGKHQKLNGRFQLLDMPTILTYCLPLAMSTGFMWVQLGGYRFLIENFWGLEQLGFLVLGLQVAHQVWWLVESLAMQFFGPLLYKQVDSSSQHESMVLAYSDYLNILIPAYLVVTGAMLLSAPYLLSTLVSSQYHETTIFIIIGTVIELCRVLGNAFGNAANIKRKTHLLILPYAIGALVSIALIFLAGSQGANLQWAAIGLLIGGCVMLTVMALVMLKLIRFKADWSRILSGFTIMLAMAFVGFLMPRPTEFFTSIGMLIAIALFSLGVIFSVLMKSASLQRALNIKLTDSKK